VSKGKGSRHTIDLAAELYGMWHEREPRDTFEEKIDFPKKMKAFGWATHILYESNKWTPRKFNRYIHKFESEPLLYAAEGTYFPKECEYDLEEPTAALLGVDSLAEVYGFPVLAGVLSLTWRDWDGGRHRIAFKSYQPVMSCSVDQQSVVIFADDLLIINGGSMVVGAPGIIN